MIRYSFLLLLVVAIGFSGCNKDDDSLEQQYKAIDAYIAKKNLQGVVTTESGLRYVVTEEGTGDFPQAGQTVGGSLRRYETERFKI